jgi:uncharacterized protein (DUF924 family)
MNTQHSLFLLAAIWAGCDRAQAGSALGRGDHSPALQPAATPAPAATSAEPPPARGNAVVDFWRAVGPSGWFAKDPELDRRFRETFAALYAAAARGELAHWMNTPEDALGLILLLDQYPRNSFRGTPRMYATDALARQLAYEAIAAGHDDVVEAQLRLFFYLPLGHSEVLADQERSVELCRSLGQPSLSRAEHHRDIVRRFGRFPHRNAILGRASRPEEERFLAEGGFAG